MQNILDRFLRYTKIHTTSDPNSKRCPSTERQWDLAKMLHQELLDLGLDCNIDHNGYVMAQLESNCGDKIPAIGFIAHYDTSPDFNGKEVKPQIHRNYAGGNILINKEKEIELDAQYFPELEQYIGQDIITTDGTTLLGADDKAGVAAIISAMEFLVNHPETKHGKICIGFTPDEEIGRGAHLFDVEKFGAQWAYTIDGGEIGELEYENFNAAGAEISFQGKSVHPGYAYHKMQNAALFAAEWMDSLPKNETPATTKKREGFYHITAMQGNVTDAKVELIIRDFDKDAFEARKAFIQKSVQDFNAKYGADVAHLEMKDQYFNMLEIVKEQAHIIEIAEQAILQADVKPIKKPIRGGTDGSQLSYKGLPCPNIFAGGHNFHGPFEFIPVPSLEKAAEVIVHICKLTEEKYR